MYSDIIFSANDAWGHYVYSFRVNMKIHELSVEYKNNQGGYTINGIKLVGKKFRHVEIICVRATKFFKSPKLEDDVFAMDPNTWHLKMIKEDGSHSEELGHSVTDSFVAPDFVCELVKLVMDLASFDNKVYRYF